MTAVRMISLACEADRCTTRYPADGPALNVTLTALRATAEKVGWQVRHGKGGQDVCPACRIKVIQSAAEDAEAMTDDR